MVRSLGPAVGFAGTTGDGAIMNAERFRAQWDGATENLRLKTGLVVPSFSSVKIQRGGLQSFECTAGGPAFHPLRVRLEHETVLQRKRGRCSTPTHIHASRAVRAVRLASISPALPGAPSRVKNNDHRWWCILGREHHLGLQEGRCDKSGEVVVSVAASPVLSYAAQVFDGSRQHHLGLPVVPGCGAIGQIAAVGPNATRLKPGEWVFCDPAVRSREDPVMPDTLLQGWIASGESAERLHAHFHDGPSSSRNSSATA